MVAQLHAHLQKAATWKWSEDEDKVFQESKRLLTFSRVLLHYNTKLPLLMACDPSPFGIVPFCRTNLKMEINIPLRLHRDRCRQLRKLFTD